MAVKQEERVRQRLRSFASRVKQRFGVSIPVSELQRLLDEAWRKRLRDRNMRGEAVKVFGNVCVHAVYGYTNVCGGTHGVFGSVHLSAHDARYPCGSAPHDVSVTLWCG